MSRFFNDALPVFEQGKSEMINVSMGLYCSVDFDGTDKVSLNIAASGIYRIFINGRFYSCGPARCGHGSYRCDEFELSDCLTAGTNHIAAEVTGYNVNSYYLLDQPSFVQCEIFKNGISVAATGKDGFTYYHLNERIRKTQRYSFQRTLTEVYNFTPGFSDWRTGSKKSEIECTAEYVGEKNIIARLLPRYSFEKVYPVGYSSAGKAIKSRKCQKWNDRSLNITDIFKGYPKEELEVCLSDEITGIDLVEGSLPAEKYNGSVLLNEGEFVSLDFGTIHTGFIAFDLKCDEDSEIYIVFDEHSKHKVPQPLECGTVDVIKITAGKGSYKFQAAEPYGFRYLGYISKKGAAAIDNTAVIKYECPVEITAKCQADGDLSDIWNAAVNTYRQNAVDIFMDCPSRERAGWLCDSFFTSRTEKLLTGQNLTERNFFENFAVAEKFKFLPEGMLPMCYPSDHPDGNYIPNWAMWFVIQLADRVKRGNADDLPERLKDKVYKLIAFFEKYENEYGLLEKLEQWVFVEWSKAGDFVQDVNYPTNMLYAQMLISAGELYGDSSLIEKAAAIKENVNRMSFDGKFYRDHSVRENGKLILCDDVSETCQYYAFFFKIATPQSRPELWKILTEEFGPDRKKNGKYPEIHYSNAFIGNYMRLDILSTNGFEKQCLDEMTGYFRYMADSTGTLWENDSDDASCNHGFASYAAVLIDRCLNYR